MWTRCRASRLLACRIMSPRLPYPVPGFRILQHPVFPRRLVRFLERIENQQWRWRLVPAMRGADISQGEAFNPPESSPHDWIVGGGYCTRGCRIAACVGDRE